MLRDSTREGGEVRVTEVDTTAHARLGWGGGRGENGWWEKRVVGERDRERRVARCGRRFGGGGGDRGWGGAVGVTRDGFWGVDKGLEWWRSTMDRSYFWTGAIFGLVLFLRLCERSKVGIRVSAASRNIFFGRRPLRERELEFGAEE